MKKVLVVFLFLVFMFSSMAFAFNEPGGYGNYRWGQQFSEFKGMAELHKDKNDKNISVAVASGVSKTWGKLKFKKSPLFVFNRLRFEGFFAEGYPGKSEWEKWCLILGTELGAPTNGSIESNYMRWEGQYTWVQIGFDPEKNSNTIGGGAYLEKLPANWESRQGDIQLPAQYVSNNPFEDGFNGVEWGAKSYALGNLKFDFDDPEINVKFYTGKGNLEVKEFGGASLKKDSLVYGFKDSVFCMIMGTAESKDAGTFESLGKYFEGFLGRSDKFSPNKSQIWEKEQYKVSLSRIKDGSIVFWYVNRQYF